MKQIFYHVLFHAKAFNAIVRLYPRHAIRENSDSARGQRILHSYVLEVPRHTADGILDVLQIVELFVKLFVIFIYVTWPRPQYHRSMMIIISNPT